MDHGEMRGSKCASGGSAEYSLRGMQENGENGKNRENVEKHR